MANSPDKMLCPACQTQNTSIYLVGKQYCFFCANCEHEYVGERLVAEELITETIFQRFRPLIVAIEAAIKNTPAT